MTRAPNGLLTINPGDIATIEVLKDIGSTSYYGVRGANGVVLITTQRGRDRPSGQTIRSANFRSAYCSAIACASSSDLPLFAARTIRRRSLKFVQL